jgi:hypothetical protein
MPISRAAAEMEPVRATASSRSALPGPMAISAPSRIRSLGLMRLSRIGFHPLRYVLQDITKRIA